MAYAVRGVARHDGVVRRRVHDAGHRAVALHEEHRRLMGHALAIDVALVGHGEPAVGHRRQRLHVERGEHVGAPRLRPAAET